MITSITENRYSDIYSIIVTDLMDFYHTYIYNAKEYTQKVCVYSVIFVATICKVIKEFLTSYMTIYLYCIRPSEL